jgi:hypothetical protein
MTLLVQHSAYRGSSYRRNVATSRIIYMICPYSIARLSLWGGRGSFTCPWWFTTCLCGGQRRGREETAGFDLYRRGNINLQYRNTYFSGKEFTVPVKIHVPASFRCKYKQSDGTGTGTLHPEDKKFKTIYRWTKNCTKKASHFFLDLTIDFLAAGLPRHEFVFVCCFIGHFLPF